MQFKNLTVFELDFIAVQWLMDRQVYRHFNPTGNIYFLAIPWAVLKINLLSIFYILDWAQFTLCHNDYELAPHTVV